MASLFTEDPLESAPVKFISYKVDPLALIIDKYSQQEPKWAVSNYLTSEGKGTTTVSADAVVKATAIRAYYRNKFLFKALKEGTQQLTSFRQALCDLLVSEDKNTIRESDLSILMKLPEFYEEDITIDQLASKYDMTESAYDNSAIMCKKTLTFIMTTHRKTKEHNKIHYWFSDESNNVCKFILDPNNQLLPLFEREIKRGPLRVEATWFPAKITGQDHTCWLAGAWSLID